MSRLQFDKKKPPSKLIHPASAAFHAQVSQYEDDNTAVEAANKTSAAAETTVSVVSHERQTSKQRQSRAAHIGEEARHEAKNRQHENIKRQYAEKKRNAEKTGEDIRDLTEKAAEAVRKTKTYIAEHKKGFLIAIAIVLVLDHSISGENSVHFLNKVDERDLLALLDEGEIDELTCTCTCTEKCGIGHINTDCPVCYLKMSDCLGLEPEPVIQPEPISEPEPSPVVEPPEDQPAVDSRVIVLAALLTVLIVLVIILIITGSRKPKVKGNTDLDEYYAEDEGYAEFEKYDPKEGEK